MDNGCFRPVANTDTKLLIYGLFQKGRVLAQDDIAYKAESNFVAVVSQKSRLKLSINLHFHELYDPRGLAKDVTNIGYWGNGDIEVSLGTLEELPYVMGLVRQAFEKQMGNGAVEA